MTVGGSSGTVGLTKTILEEEAMSEGGATYMSPVLFVGIFYNDDEEDIASEVGMGRVDRPRGGRRERGHGRNPRG
jgi:hypothetical protein